MARKAQQCDITHELFLALLRQAGLPEPRHKTHPDGELLFHPTRKWRFDYAWIDRKIAVECEGGAWKGGRHNRGKGFERDIEKYAEAMLLGWQVLRVTPKMLTDGAAIHYLEGVWTNGLGG